jgi:hypothetical protein
VSALDDTTHVIFDEGATKVRDGRPGRFWMDDSIYDVWGERLGVYGIAVYGLLCRRADAKGRSYPGLKGMARMLKISKSKLCTTLDELEAHGLISRTQTRDAKGSHTTTIYTVHEPPTLVRTEDKGSPRQRQAPVRRTDTKEHTIEGRHNEGTQKRPKKKESDAARRRQQMAEVFGPDAI